MTKIDNSQTNIRRLTLPDLETARALFLLMAGVFEEPAQRLGTAYLEKMLSDETIWIMAAFADGQVVGGLTAHSLPMTYTQSTELLIYDLAVLESHQRQGIGGKLIAGLRQLAQDVGIATVFVMVDNEDLDALEFYRKQKGTGAAVTVFEF